MSAGAAGTLRAAAERIAARLCARREPHGYTWDLALEAMLGLSAVTGDARWRTAVGEDIARRGWRPEVAVPWRSEPFCCLSWAWAQATGDAHALACFVAESAAIRRELPRTSDGLITHPRGASRGGGDAVLIDSFQEYISRVARAGAVTGDVACFADCVEQVRRHRDLLRDPASGLWHQGRGWLGDRPGELSPGTWSRGQGWILRGLVSALEATPRDTPAFASMQGVLVELAHALCRRQQPSGMWHALPHRPPTQSGPEASGTGLVAAGFLRAIRTGLLPADPYQAHAQRAVAALLPRIDADGLVHDACPGPGPLQVEEPWMVPSFPPGDAHGFGTVLEALVAALRAIPA